VLPCKVTNGKLNVTNEKTEWHKCEGEPKRELTFEKTDPREQREKASEF
jgi:hypothetical protein